MDCLRRLLQDGRPHLLEELLACLDEPGLATRNALRVAVYRIRRDLRPLGQDVLCVCLGRRRVAYQQIKLL